MTCNATDDDHDGGGHDDGEAEAGCHPADAGAHGHDHLRTSHHSYLQLNIYITVCHPLAVADEAQRDAEAAPDQDAVHGARHVVVQGAAVDVPDGHQGA